MGCSNKRKSDRRNRETKSRKAAREKSTMASVVTKKAKNSKANGIAPPEREVVLIMNNVSVPVNDTEAIAVAECSSSAQGFSLRLSAIKNV